MALSKDAKFRLEHALTDKGAGDEMSAAIDLSTISAAANAAKVLGSNFVVAGILIATATDNTDAATLGFLIGDTIALIKDADQTLQTVVTDDEFASVPAVGDLIIQLRSV